jgi:glycosyltransferase involved in cell wall biosynthesis
MVPIFVISYNRGVYLERVIASYRRQSVPVDIVIHDFGSDDAETLRILVRLEASGVKVVRSSKITAGDQLNRVDETVQAYFRDMATPRRYVVTDCDIDLSIAAANSLTVYDDLLDRFPQAECVGPMLRIVDVPRHFPLYNKVMNRHIEQFWHREPQWQTLSSGETVAYLPAPIDTTFALHRANEPFRRLKKAIRVYHPYEAQHLDWYQSAADLRASSYFQGSRPGIGNWSNRSWHSQFCDEPLQYSHAIYVDRDAGGRLIRRVWQVGTSSQHG